MMSDSGAYKTPDICAIIEACGKAGVREFSYQGLLLAFGPKPVAIERAAQTIEYAPIPAEIEKKAESQTRDALLQDELLHKKDELEQMLITNPDAYFDAIRAGDLIDEKGT